MPDATTQPGRLEDTDQALSRELRQAALEAMSAALIGCSALIDVLQTLIAQSAARRES